MKKGGFTAILTVAAVVLVIVFIFYAQPGIADQAVALKTVAKTQTINAAITGVGVDNATATLQFPLFDGNTNGVTSLSSDLGTDNPLVTTYNTATKLITITGLTDNSTRTLTLAYLTERPNLNPGVSLFSGWGLVFLSVLVIALIVAVIIKIFL